jgi:hypothetical protein
VARRARAEKAVEVNLIEGKQMIAATDDDDGAIVDAGEERPWWLDIGPDWEAAAARAGVDPATVGSAGALLEAVVDYGLRLRRWRKALEKARAKRREARKSTMTIEQERLRK